jgi:outer membrane protein OmpA-like peptidoglycan-associated protein
VAASRDTDGDGIADAEDACPNEPGVSSEDPARRGCPAGVVVVETMGMVILEQIHFRRDDSTLPSESFPIVDATIAVMKARPEVGQVEVGGHASPDEPSAQRLSERRAEAVLDRMVAAGIDPKRLVTRGYGSSKPIAENRDTTGREQNRRVEFRIIEGSSSSAAAASACSAPATARGSP